MLTSLAGSQYVAALRVSARTSSQAPRRFRCGPASQARDEQASPGCRAQPSLWLPVDEHPTGIWTEEAAED